MADYKKVIEGLERCDLSGYCTDKRCPYYKDANCRELLRSNTISLLKAQEQVEPVIDIDTWKCGNCGHTLEHQELLGDNVLFHEHYNYCPECGRKVKWNV